MATLLTLLVTKVETPDLDQPVESWTAMVLVCMTPVGLETGEYG